MPTARIASLALTLILGLACVCGTSTTSLRGRSVDSPDGKTYLVVEDDNGGACGPILVDGEKWTFAIGAPGPVRPGKHVIQCGGEIEFEVAAGKTFHFDYWGP